MTFRPGSRSAFAALTLAGFAAVALLPAAAAFLPVMREADGLGAFRAVLAEPRQWALLKNSLTIAAASALAASALGAALAFALEYVRVPGRRQFTWLLGLPLLVPSYISAVAWIDILGRSGALAQLTRDAPGLGPAPVNIYSILGVVLVLGLSYYPVPMYLTAAALVRLDARLEEAAKLTASPARTFLAITLPLAAPSIMAGALFVFILALTSFAAPSLMQVQVYPVEIYSRFAAFHNFGEGAALAVPLVLIGGLALLGGRMVIRPGRAWLGGAARPRPAGAAGPLARGPLLLLCVLTLIIAAGLPLAALMKRALPLSSFALALSTAREEIAASLALALLSALLICALGLGMTVLGRRGAGRVYAMSFIPFMISGPVLGTGLIALWNHAGPAALVYDSFLIVVLAAAGRYLVFGHQGLAAAFGALDRGLLEAAEVSGVPWSRQLAGIVIPLLAPALAAAFGISFILCLGELDAVVLVAPPGITTLPVRIFTLMHYGPSQAVAALALITVAAILAAALLTAWAYGRLRVAGVRS